MGHFKVHSETPFHRQIEKDSIMQYSAALTQLSCKSGFLFQKFKYSVRPFSVNIPKSPSGPITEKANSTGSTSKPYLYRVGNYDEFSPDMFDENIHRRLTAEEKREKILHPEKKLYNARTRSLEQAAKGAFFKPTTEKEKASDSANIFAYEKSFPIRPLVPWERSIAVPKVYDPITRTYRQIYEPSVVLPAVDNMMKEIKLFARQVSLKDKDPWYPYYGWTQHEFFSTRHVIRLLLPGFGYASVIFGIYCVVEVIYEFYLDNIYYA